MRRPDGIHVTRFGAAHAALKVWERILDALHDVIDAYEQVTDEACVLWGEQALVSFLTAAVWRVKGVAIAEFVTTKKGKKDRRTRALGRSDLWLQVGDRSFCVEAKRREVSLPRITGAISGVVAAVDDADNTASKAQHHIVAVTFIAWKPLNDDDDFDELLEPWHEQLRELAETCGYRATLCVDRPTDHEELSGYSVVVVLT